MLQRTLTAVAFSLAASLFATATTDAGETAKTPAVVELFTSQGCDTCPPADAVLDQLADRKDVIALSLPVTYWDMLGWKDTLATDANTRRQKSYAAAMGHGGVYTPQMIVDGTVDMVGNKMPLVEAAIAAHASSPDSVHVTLHATPGEISIAIGAAPASGDATVWLFHIMSWATVKVGSGENTGRTLTYRNVVRDVKPVGLWKGQPVTINLPRGDTPLPPHDSIAVVVQQGGGYGRIVGAAMLGRPDYIYQ